MDETGGRGDIPEAPLEAPADSATESTLSEVLDTSSHPWLRWLDLADVASAISALYLAEPDGLVWFRGNESHPAITSAIQTLKEFCSTKPHPFRPVRAG